MTTGKLREVHGLLAVRDALARCMRPAPREPRTPDTTRSHDDTCAAKPLRLLVSSLFAAWPWDPPTQSCEAQEPKRTPKTRPHSLRFPSTILLPFPSPAPRRHRIPSAAGAAAVLSLVKPPTTPLATSPPPRPPLPCRGHWPPSRLPLNASTSTPPLHHPSIPSAK